MSLPQLFNSDIIVNAAIVKALILFVPLIGLITAFIIRPPSFYQRVGMMLGILWNLSYLILFNILAIKMHWWDYAASANTFYAIPLELLIGWSIFWGAFLPYCFEKTSIFMPLMLVLLIDMVVMPKLNMLFTLGEYWLVGEAVFLIACLLPSLLIYRFTVARVHVGCRALLQSIIWGGWIIFLIPAVVLSFDGKDIFLLFDLERWPLTVFFNAMAFAIFIGYAALNEFAKVGQGTPIPFDPPKYLVTTGPYAYVANPLQISTLIMFVSIGLLFQSFMMLFPIITVVVFSEIFVRWHHQVDIKKRFGEEWLSYREHVNNWLPRWTPYIKQPSLIFFSKECEICQDTEHWVKHLKPIGIHFNSAKDHPTQDLDRVTYQHYSQRFEEKSVSAIARTFEHINLSFALLGWMMRLPMITQCLQLLVDVNGRRGEKVMRENNQHD